MKATPMLTIPNAALARLEAPVPGHASSAVGGRSGKELFVLRRRAPHRVAEWALSTVTVEIPPRERE